MTKVVLALVGSWLFLEPAGIAEAPSRMTSNPSIRAGERAKALDLLSQSRTEFLAALDGVDESRWSFRSSPLKWSVGQVAEHIVLTEQRIFSIIEGSMARDPDPDWERKTAGKQELLERVLPSRTGRAQAPVEVRPTGKLTREEVLQEFERSRAKVLAFTEKTELPLKAHTYDNPFFKTLNCPMKGDVKDNSSPPRGRQVFFRCDIQPTLVLTALLRPATLSYLRRYSARLPEPPAANTMNRRSVPETYEAGRSLANHGPIGDLGA